MKKIFSFLTIALVCGTALAATPAADRRGIAGQQVMNAPRVTASKNQINAMASGNPVTADKSSVRAETPSAPAPRVDDRDKEKQACINNNIGVGNTFVWASRYSNTNNYYSMVEDVENPDNNVCFVKIEIKSDDSRVSTSDVAPVYYEMGRTITCGSWADSKKLKQRILDAKKSGRTWGTVAGAVGGAAVGVGAMDLFGNKLIGGSVQGQKSLNSTELLRSQLAVLKDKDPAQYNTFRMHLQNLKTECERDIWNDVGAPSKPSECSSLNYDALLML